MICRKISIDWVHHWSIMQWNSLSVKLTSKWIILKANIFFGFRILLFFHYDSTEMSFPSFGDFLRKGKKDFRDQNSSIMVRRIKHIYVSSWWCLLFILHNRNHLNFFLLYSGFIVILRSITRTTFVICCYFVWDSIYQLWAMRSMVIRLLFYIIKQQWNSIRHLWDFKCHMEAAFGICAI